MPISILTTIDEWIEFLDDYNDEQLLAKPLPNIWSIGQVYMHLLSETTYFISQAKLCASSDENKHRDMHEDGKVMFANNSFPDEQILGPPSNDLTPQPISKQQISEDFQTLRASLSSLLDTLSYSIYEGKSQHPGLGFFNAKEWIRFADMHLRHHFRQKKRIDEMII